MLFSVMVLVGSAVLRRAAATQSAAANGMSGMTAAPSLPGPGGSAGYAPKEYIKVFLARCKALRVPDAGHGLLQLDLACWSVVHGACQIPALVGKNVIRF